MDTDLIKKINECEIEMDFLRSSLLCSQKPTLNGSRVGKDQYPLDGMTATLICDLQTL